MKERPILFSAPMVRALLNGSKTQTRRVVKPQPNGNHRGKFNLSTFTADEGIETYWQNYPLWGPVRSPYGKQGDQLWVRETFYIDLIPYDRGPLPKAEPTDEWKESTYYRADGECCQQISECCCYEVGPTPWRPSIHMTRWASRILLYVVSMRIERLQNISEEDAIAEGIEQHKTGLGKAHVDPRLAYRDLWESINGPGSWDANPWVWVICFKVVQP